MVWLFFGLSGRIGRWPFFLGSMFIGVIEALVLYHLAQAPEGSSQQDLLGILFSAAWLGSLWPMVALSVKRLHDVGQSGILAAATLVPALSIVAFFVLCLWPGNPGANRFGGLPNAPGA
ncbi:MAG: DUF805 domain-containing protein [Rhizobiaceae bacterium]